MPASGTFGFGEGYAKQYDLESIRCFGYQINDFNAPNRQSRQIYADGPSSTLNAVGLKNPGAEVVLHEKLPWLASHYPDLPIIASIAGADVAEIYSSSQKVKRRPKCKSARSQHLVPECRPRRHGVGTDPSVAAAVTKAVKEASSVPIFVKLTPNVTDITTIAKAVEAAGADGVSLINTFVGMR